MSLTIDAPVLPEPPRTDDSRGLVELAGRNYAGLAVQLLWDRFTGQTFLTVVIGGESGLDETVEVPNAEALRAFNHPFLYSTLSI